MNLTICRLGAFAPDLDPALIRPHLEAIERIAAGDPTAGPIASLGKAERFHWLVSPARTIIQTSDVHTGFCDDPAAELDHLVATLVARGHTRRLTLRRSTGDAALRFRQGVLERPAPLWCGHVKPQPGPVVRGPARLAKRGLQPRRDLAGAADRRLGHQEAKARRPRPNGSIRGPRVRTDQIGEVVGDDIRRSRIRCAADLEQEHRCRSSVARVPGCLMPERGRPVGPRVELPGWSAQVRSRLGTARGRSAGAMQEGPDPHLGSFVVLVLGEDEPTGASWLSLGRGGKVFGRFGHAHEV